MKRIYYLTLMVFMVTTACGSESRIIPTITSTPTLTLDQMIPTPRYRNTIDTPTNTPVPTATDASVLLITSTPEILETAQTMTETLAPSTGSDEWMELPVIPSINPNISEIYNTGQALGNNPSAFSIFGDCQSRPAEFFGIYETDPAVYNSLSPDLQQTVTNFTGSFNRESSTSQDGTTPGGLLWTEWHRGEYGCTAAETPVDCELRTHRPSFVIIQIGTHFESRNTEYLRTIITQLLDAGVVPILATKADNRELDNRINRDMALLATEFDLPLWNFWAALSGLPDRGLYVMEGREEQGAVYLNTEASELHRMTGLIMLDAVWRAATGN
ncbi:MAG: hypothetical protein IPJ46_12695 [Anaerolineales bacterium]|nr:hypothetical protein [Anaerolineales bacterium]